MRIRQVKPEFWGDEALRTLTDTERLVFIGLWQQADDSGFLRWEPARIAHELFPWKAAARRERELVKAGERLAELGRLELLECSHATIPRLGKHQHLAGTTKRVYTFQREHDTECGAVGPEGDRGTPRKPALVRLG